LKKGCFLKIIIGLTIIIAVILYVIQYHLDDWIVNPSKEFFSELFVSGIDDELSFIKDSPEKDSLRILLKTYLQDKFTATKELSNKDIDWLVDSVKIVISDSIITDNDLNKIKKLIDQKGYERPEKN
jgi:hypothetical protein